MNIDPDTEATLKVIEIGGTLEDARECEQIILRELEHCGYSRNAMLHVRLVLGEAMVNAVEHGNRGDPNKRITVRFSVTPERALILIRDQGDGFDPSAIPEPTLEDALPHALGRGLMLMRAYTSEFGYREGGTEVYLLKRNDAYLPTGDDPARCNDSWSADGMEFDSETEATLKPIVIDSTHEATKEPAQIIMRELNRFGYSEDAAFDIHLALSEAMANAVKHGNRGDPSKRIKVRYSISPARAVILVRDQGDGFDPSIIPDPTKADHLPLTSGRGIMLMRAYMSEVHYRRNGTEVCLIKANDA